MKKFFLIFVFFCLLSIAHPVLAEEIEYTLLQPLPLSGASADDIETTTPSQYINGIFMLLIAVAGGLAVIKIVFGGIKYMSSDAIGGKSEAKDTISNAIWGLLLAIGAWIILYTIDPTLIDFSIVLEPL